MDKIKREGEKKHSPDPTASNSYLVMILIIIGVVSLGLLAVNQFLEFKFKAEFLSSPCNLCEKLNPHLNNCFEESSNIIEGPNSPIIIYEDINLE